MNTTRGGKLLNYHCLLSYSLHTSLWGHRRRQWNLFILFIVWFHPFCKHLCEGLFILKEAIRNVFCYSFWWYHVANGNPQTRPTFKPTTSLNQVTHNNNSFPFWNYLIVYIISHCFESDEDMGEWTTSLITGKGVFLLRWLFSICLSLFYIIGHCF